MLKEREDEVRDIMTGVPGFMSYGIMDTGKGAVSVTTCQDKAGTDESIQRAARWIKENLPDAKIDPPRILEGEQVVRFNAEGLSTSARGDAHLVVRIFSGPPPDGLRDRMDEVRTLMTAVPGFRTYVVVDTGHGQGGVSFIVGKDRSVTDEVSRRMAEFVRSQWPDFKREPPQVIEAEGVFRFDAQAAPV